MPDAAGFKVKTGDFEGPLELLLNLVEERKLHISRVSLAAVTDSFVAYLNQLPDDHKHQIANFIVIAATLMLIKSLALLPQLPVSGEEEGDIADLERRLRYYQQIRQAAQKLGLLFGRQPILAPSDRPPAEIIFAPSRDLTLTNAAAAFRRLLAELPATEILPQAIVKKVLSLEEVISDLAARVKNTLQLSFRDYVKDRSDRLALIVSFLSLLELVKQGAVLASQTGLYQDISMETNQPGLPRYG